jgi:hypothetical protein
MLKSRYHHLRACFRFLKKTQGFCSRNVLDFALAIATHETKVMEIKPETQAKRYLGCIETRAGKKFNIFATASLEHVLLNPVDLLGKKAVKGTPVKISDLQPRMRERLGC